MISSEELGLFSQEACINKVLERLNVIPTSPTLTLKRAQVEKEDEAETEEPFPEGVGGSMWMANMTWPDILKAVREVARHIHNPSNEQWRAVVQILRYLKGTSGLKPTFRKGAGTNLVKFADVDYAKNKEYRWSIL